MVRALLAVAVLVLWPSAASAYPWMIRHGEAKCGSCHTDPSGGETLNAYGRMQGDLKLKHQWSDNPMSDARKFLFGVDTPGWLQLGGSYRHMTIYKPEQKDATTFPMQMDVYGHVQTGDFRAGLSLGLGRVEQGSPHVHAAQITHNQGNKMNLISRNHWVGWKLTPELLLRGGRINLPFGQRIVEHVMWVRDATQTDRESDQQHGVALAFTTKKVRGEVMGIAGNYQVNPDAFRERGYSGFAEYLLTDHYALGLTSLTTFADQDLRGPAQGKVMRGAHGVMGRLSPAEPLVLLVEADALLRTDRDFGYVGMLQADLEFLQGLHFMLTGEILDEGTIDGSSSAPGAGEPKLGGWVTLNWFFFSHFDMRVDAVFREQEDFSLQAQFHVYL